MHLVTSLIRVGGSVTMVIPPAVLKEMKLVPYDKLVIKYNKGEMKITKLGDLVAVWDKIDKG